MFQRNCCLIFENVMLILCRSHWPCGLRRRSAAFRLLRLWFRIPPRTWMLVCCECCVLSGRGLCDELITRPEGSYRLWCVVVCDLETSRGGRDPLEAVAPNNNNSNNNNNNNNTYALILLCVKGELYTLDKYYSDFS